MTDIGTLGGTHSAANAINDLGHIVGWSDVGNEHRAFLYSGSTMTDIGTLGGATTEA